jgi:hypothetical protein
MTIMVIYAYFLTFSNYGGRMARSKLFRALTAVLLSLPFILQAQEETKKSPFKPYGLAMYRFRLDYLRQTPETGDPLSSLDFQHRVAYKVGLKATMNEQVSFQFEIGNDWYATEQVSLLGSVGKSNWYKVRNDMSPYFSVAKASWNPGYLNLDVGIIPVALQGSAMMDLLGVSLYWQVVGAPRVYQYAAHIPWGVVTQFGLPGVHMGIPVLKGDFKLGIDLTTSMVEERKIGMSTENNEVKNNNAVMLLAEIPVSSGIIDVSPKFNINLNRNYNSSEKTADHEIAAGIDAKIKAGKMVSFHGGFGFAMFSNVNTYDPTDTTQTEFNHTGTNSWIGTAIKAGPGKVNLDVLLSTDEDKEKANSQILYPFVDLKYGWGVNRHFIIMPRVRVFLTNPEKGASVIQTWPEIMLFGVF